MRLAPRRPAPRSPAHAGFSMVEVMVAVLVISIGLMGLAKMQALALASAGTAKMGALASIEGASLAATMHADRAYWAGITTNLTIAVAADGTITSPDSELNAPTSPCTSTTTVCTSAQIAALDVHEWAVALVGTLPLTPAAPSTIACMYDTTRRNPVSCRIVIVWSENRAAQNTYTLYVNP